MALRPAFGDVPRRPRPPLRLRAGGERTGGDAHRPGLLRQPRRRVPSHCSSGRRGALMRFRPICVAIAFPFLAHAQAPREAPPAKAPQKTVLVKSARLIDGRSDRARQGLAVLVVGERIQEVGPADELARKAGQAQVIDLGDATLLPGLIDNHTHVLLQGDITAADYDEQLLKESTPYRAIRATVAARTALMNGFTTIRDLETEGAMYADVDVKVAIQRGVIPGPRMYVATRAMAPTGMYPLLGYSWELRMPEGVQIVVGAVDDLHPFRHAQLPRVAEQRVHAGRRHRARRDVHAGPGDDAALDGDLHVDVGVHRALGLQVADGGEAVHQRGARRHRGADGPVGSRLLEELLVVVRRGDVALEKDVGVVVDQPRQERGVAEVDDLGLPGFAG